MTDKTARWIWRDCYEDVSEVVFDAQALSFIRGLRVLWDEVENGAAGLTADDADAGFAEDAFDADQEALIDLFLTTATLNTTKGQIANPYAADREDEHWMLEDVPDPAIRDLFLSGQPIPYEVSPEDQKLWDEANLGRHGIDPKRPFGSESVSRDMRAILDPDKALSNQAFGKLRKAAESRLMLMLQFFVQHAELPFDTYTRNKSYQWVPTSSMDREAGEWLDRTEWALRVQGMVYDQSRDFTETAKAVEHLVWQDRLPGDYAALNAQLKLHNHYQDHSQPRYVGLTRDMAETGLEAFPEAGLPLDQKWLVVTLLRILNGTAEFEAARDLMQAHEIWDMDPEGCSLQPLNAEAVLFYESIITRVGLGLLTVDELEDVLGNIHPDYRSSTLRGASPWTWDILHLDSIPDDVPLYRFGRATAVAAQLRIMRGPYRPD